MSDVEPGSEVPVGQDVFVAEFRRWRDLSGLSRAALAKVMGYSRSYVSKVESGTEHASREFVKTADSALNTGGALQRVWREQEAARATADTKPDPTSVTALVEPASGLLVEHDHAELYYDGDTYRLTQWRRLVNNGDQPVTRYLIRISVDRYPGDPERSNELYRNNPLTWPEIDLHAWAGDDRAEPMQWSVQHDRDAFKEVRLSFANDSRLSLSILVKARGSSTPTPSAMTSGETGSRRAVRLPTKHLSIRRDFPADLDPVVWGLHTSMAAESMPFPTAIQCQEIGDRRIYSWSTENPPLHARYRLDWTSVTSTMARLRVHPNQARS